VTLFPDCCRNQQGALWEFENSFLEIVYPIMATMDFVNSLSVQSLVGSGGFADVYMAKSTTKQCVLKTINKQKMNLANVEREIKAGQLLKHSNITNYICHFHDEKNYYLALDYINGIINAIAKLTENKGKISLLICQNEVTRLFLKTKLEQSFLN
jgi:predicted Ser/Thr protein kinase